MNGALVMEAIVARTASLLGPPVDRMVFVGGAVRGLLVTDPAVEAVRPTKDVDAVVQAASRGDYQALDAALRGRGFENDTGMGTASESPQ